VARHAPQCHAVAAQAGIDLVADIKLPWLTRHGHVAPSVRSGLPSRTVAALDEILQCLGGDGPALAAKTRGAMRGDFLLRPDELLVEYDEIQHFTSARIATLALYPPDAVLSFRPAEYAAIAELWREKGDRAFAHKSAAEFPGPQGRQRQRAYFDAFRDLAAPHFTPGPVLRLPAPGNDYTEATHHLQRLTAAVRSSSQL
jgi:hypothetical protein